MRRFPRLPRLAYVTFVLALPLGFQPTRTDSTALSVGVFGGTGEAVAILRDCSGHSLAQSTVHFRETAFAFGFTQADYDNVVTVGIRGGRFESDDVLDPDHLEESRHFDRWYLNPHVAIEGETFGVGFGLIAPGVVAHVRELGGPDESVARKNSRTQIPLSGHLRVGQRNDVYMQASLAENTPIYSGGGLFNIGLGYRVMNGARGFTGFSTGFYEQPAMLQQASIDVPSTPIQVQLSTRFGGFGNDPESGGSVGLVYSPGVR